MKLKSILLMIIAAFVMVACNDDDESVIKDSLLYVNAKFPKAFENKSPRLKSAIFRLKNVNTGENITREVEYFPVSYFNVEDGLYNISISGIMEYNAQTAKGDILTKKVEIRAQEENITVKGGNFDSQMNFFVYNPSTSFVISEVYFSGSKTPEGKQYNEDKFIEIYNNSNEVLYADGLCIAETELLTTMSLNEYTPDIREEAVPVSAVYRIPGSGKEYPVKPGETILLCDIAINHKVNNSNSFDLSKANFEWFDENDRHPDIDVPEVVNLEKMVSKSKSVWSLHNRGYKGYILFRSEVPITTEQFTTDYAYPYKYHFVFNSFEKWMEFDAWKAPNSWVIDAVQCSTPSAYEWNVMSPSLDISWTHSGDSDDARYGHSVKRKVSHKEGERIVLQDTNDSAFDFIPTAVPSPGMVEKEQ